MAYVQEKIVFTLFKL